MNYDLTLIERTGYTLTDLLSDIGGIQGILISAMAMVLGVLNANHLENHLVTKLFKSESNDATLNQPSFCENLVDFIIPRKFSHRYFNKKLLMEQARSAL